MWWLWPRSTPLDVEVSTVTYTSVYTNSEPWRFQWVFDDEPEAPEEDPYVEAALQALPPSPDYVHGPEHPPSPDYVPGPEYPPSPAYVPEPEYLEYLVRSDVEEPMEEQPYATDSLPTTLSPGYVANSNPEEDEDEEDHADYPADGGDDDDDDDDDNDEEEEHLAPTHSIAFAFLVDHASSAEETKLFETDESVASPPPHPAYRVEILLALPTPPPSPLTLLSSPLPYIPSPPLPASPTYPLGYRASMAIMRAATPSTYYLITRSEIPPSETPPLLPIPLPTPSPSLLLPSTDCRADMPEDEIVEAMQDRPAAEVTNVAELNLRMTDFATTVRQDTDKIYERLDDAQDDRVLTSSRLNMLHRDRHAYARTDRLMEAGIRLSREAWRRSMDASDIARSETMALRTIVVEN
ncbi:hypothetical protein Tco_0731291 [Tanacetum coccineum]